MVGCSSKVLDVVLPSAAELAAAMLLMLLNLPRTGLPVLRAAAAPDRSMLSSSSARLVMPVSAAAPVELLLMLPLPPGVLLAAANALPDDVAPVPELRKRPLLPPVRLLRSAAGRAAVLAAAASPSQAPELVADAPLGSGSSELPVAAVLNGLAAAAANGLLTEEEPLRPLLGRLLLWLPLLPGLPESAASLPLIAEELAVSSALLAAIESLAASLFAEHESGEEGVAFSPAARSPADGGARSMITTVMLSLLPLSTAALVSTVAATRAAALREAPFSCNSDRTEH